MPPSPPALGQTGLDPEGMYERAFKTGLVTKAQFEKNCAGYGFTKAKHGTSWDDKCLAHEYQNKIGPVFGLLKEDKPEMPAWLVPALLAGAGVALYVIFR
jgi:hypothetical protein